MKDKWRDLTCVCHRGFVCVSVCVCGHMLEAVLIQRDENKWEHAYTLHLPWQSGYTIAARRPDRIKTTARCGWQSLRSAPPPLDVLAGDSPSSHRSRSDFCFLAFFFSLFDIWTRHSDGALPNEAWRCVSVRHVAPAFASGNFSGGSSSCVSLPRWTLSEEKEGAAQHAAKITRHDSAVRVQTTPCKVNFGPVLMRFCSKTRFLPPAAAGCKQVLRFRVASGVRFVLLLCFHFWTHWPVGPYLTYIHCNYSH